MILLNQWNSFWLNFHLFLESPHPQLKSIPMVDPKIFFRINNIHSKKKLSLYVLLYYIMLCGIAAKLYKKFITKQLISSKSSMGQHQLFIINKKQHMEVICSHMFLVLIFFFKVRFYSCFVKAIGPTLYNTTLARKRQIANVIFTYSSRTSCVYIASAILTQITK